MMTRRSLTTAVMLLASLLVVPGLARAAEPAPPRADQQPVYVTGPAIGTEVMALPGSGCDSLFANGTRYYNCGNAYYQSHFGSNGVYYTVVANPS